MISKDELLRIKEELSIEQIFQLLTKLGGDPIQKNENIIISRTICHNGSYQGSHKLYYYNDNHMFKCYTECKDSLFDIYELIKRVKNCNNELINNHQYNYQTAANYVIKFFDIPVQNDENFSDLYINLPDWNYLNKYQANSQESVKQNIQSLSNYDNQILQNIPHPRILDWEQDGIDPIIMEHHYIGYDPREEAIIIPHFDMEDHLIGIRERTLIQENEIYGKYKPAILNGVMYNHALSFNLYNLNNSKYNIKQIKKAIVFESEKATMQYASYFGEEHDISVAVCGSTLTQYQVNLLLSLGIEELIIAFDKQFKELNDSEHKQWCKKLYNINQKYANLILVSFIFDTKDRLQYKMSPVDAGPAIFMQLFKERIFL